MSVVIISLENQPISILSNPSRHRRIDELVLIDVEAIEAAFIKCTQRQERRYGVQLEYLRRRQVNAARCHQTTEPSSLRIRRIIWCSSRLCSRKSASNRLVSFHRTRHSSRSPLKQLMQDSSVICAVNLTIRVSHSTNLVARGNENIERVSLKELVVSVFVFVVMA